MQADIRIFEDSNALSHAAVEIFVETAAETMRARGRFLAALSGGSTPTGLYRLLAEEPFRNQVNWPDTFVFWGDERCVPPDDPGSNYRQAMDSFVSHVPIPNENILRIKGELEPAEAAKRFIHTLKRFASLPLDWPRFDMVLLGMGDDGHTASLFPGSPVEASAPAISVTADYQGRPAARVTLTPLVFNSARQVIFLVTGESKSAVLAHVINGKYLPQQYPAQRIRPTDGNVIWLADKAAGSKL